MTEIKCLQIFQPLIEKQKPIKIIVGGRGSTKSTFVADRVACGMSVGERWACGREFLNSIEESVHMDLQREIERLSLPGFEILKNQINHASGGKAFYVSLARNILSLKGKLTGANMWIEEGEGLSDDSIRIGFPSVRLSTLEAEKLMEEYQRERKMTKLEAAAAIPKPEIWVTMNRGSREDPISKQYLARAESTLASGLPYEDDECLIIQANYTDVPKSWFLASGLETKRLADKANLTDKQYRHKWHGEYLEEIDNALIPEEWFDACIDAHVKLGFEPQGAEIVAHDPSDLGPDPKGLAYRHGSVILEVLEKRNGDIFEGCDWALDFALKRKVDLFVFDGDGMGATLRERIDQKLDGKKIDWQMYRGSEGVEDPNDLYADGDDDNAKTNKQMFNNLRSQQYCRLRDRMRRTYEAVEFGTYHDPDTLISFSKDIALLDKLRSELCRLPLEPNGNGKIQLMSKEKMLSKYKLPSPNLADSVKMCLRAPTPKSSLKPMSFATWQ